MGRSRAPGTLRTRGVRGGARDTVPMVARPGRKNSPMANKIASRFGRAGGNLVRSSTFENSALW